MIEAIIIPYLPTLLTAFLAAIVGFVNKRLVSTTDDRMIKIDKTISSEVSAYTEELKHVREQMAAMAQDNAELKNKLNTVITELKKVEVKNNDGKQSN